jgi:hypothetical protein
MFPRRPVWTGPRQSRRYQADRVGRTFSSGPQPLADKPRLLIWESLRADLPVSLLPSNLYFTSRQISAGERSFVCGAG